jgi:hypothetical protein
VRQERRRLLEHEGAIDARPDHFTAVDGDASFL